MIPDAADYTQYRHNLRIDGFLAAFATFGFEGGGALATTFVGFALEAGGYVANGVQAPAVLNLMNLLMTMGPAIMTLTAGLIVGLPCILLTALGTKEVVRPAQNQKKISMRSQIRALKSNKPMILIFVAMTTHGISMNARLAMATYYCTYYAGDFSTFTVYNSINSIMAMAGAFTAPYVYRFFRDKGKAARYIMYSNR